MKKLVLSTNAELAAEYTANHQGCLDRSDLVDLSEEDADLLSEHYGALNLSGLLNLSDAAAVLLSKHQGALNLSGLLHISDAAAESLSNHQRIIQWRIDHEQSPLLSSLPDGIPIRDAALPDHWGDLNLSGLERISNTAAESLSKYKGSLDLSGLKELAMQPPKHSPNIKRFLFYPE